MNAITIRLDDPLDRLIRRCARQTSRSRRVIARDALRLHFAPLRIRGLDVDLLPFARARARARHAERLGRPA